MNGTVAAIDFTSDSKHMLSFGSKIITIVTSSPTVNCCCLGDGEVYVWDLANRRCIHKYVDEGCISGTTIAVSPNSEYIACG